MTSSNEPPLIQTFKTGDEVAARIDEMAAEIVRTYKDQRPLFVSLLRGSAPFTALLMFAIVRIDPDFHPEVDYMTVSTSATGAPVVAQRSLWIYHRARMSPAGPPSSSMTFSTKA